MYTYFKSFDIAPNILYTVLFIVNCELRLTLMIVGLHEAGSDAWNPEMYVLCG